MPGFLNVRALRLPVRFGFFALILPVAVTATARGAEPAAKPAAGVRGAAQPSKPEPEPEGWVPSAPNQRTGHVVLSLSGAWTIPAGELDSVHGEPSYLGPGPAAGAALGVGVGRSTVLGLWGEYQWLHSNANCASCAAPSPAAGLFVRYYLLEGARFDPWLEYGVGVRTLRLKAFELPFTYSGLEWLRVQIGGDWMATHFLGFGPFLEASAGTLTQVPAGLNPSAYFRVLGGLRITLDIPGK
jgi:hypothetical protein